MGVFMFFYVLLFSTVYFFIFVHFVYEPMIIILIIIKCTKVTLERTHNVTERTLLLAKPDNAFIHCSVDPTGIYYVSVKVTQDINSFIHPSVRLFDSTLFTATAIKMNI